MAERQRWEYFTFKIEAGGWFLGGILNEGVLSERLNELGGEGWELVSVFDTNMHEGASREIVAVLKRRVSDW